MSQEERNPFLQIAVGTQGTGKSSLGKEYMDINERTLVVPANRSDAGVSWPGMAELKVEATYEPDELDPKGKEQLVIYAPEMQDFKGQRILHVADDPRKLSALVHPDLGMRDGLLVLDDIRKYIPSNGRLPPRVANMFSDRRHLCLDIFVAVHTFNDINMQLLGWDCELVIFRTTLPPNDTVKAKVRNYTEMLDVIDRVNRIAATEPHYKEMFIPSCYE